ncbi:hypothetical protein GCM10010156_30370 [Planobispora rosea]|uniref:Uncharacterized protein n=1 Tax=Planobispora rosea TaxID=35762 RepID=A0A8J3RXJ3_PLARO|nr:hypothetical protein [Planobispora rosea]GGS69535.1 hypothetical protein GCM10010156_30370 [Planobispora rosea]GIH83145.1 hypothetical protein Pro02_15530 [Planobispora rosea]
MADEKAEPQLLIVSWGFFRSRSFRIADGAADPVPEFTPHGPEASTGFAEALRTVHRAPDFTST